MIVGIGELLWDLFPDGRKVAGGAPFNFAFHCQQLGHPAAIVSRVGDDALGRELREEVKRLGLTDQWIQTDHAHPTGTVRVTVDAAGQPAYEIVEGVAWDYIGEEGPIDEGLAHDTEAVCFGTLARRHPVSRSTIQEFVGPGPHMASALRVFDVNIRQAFFTKKNYIDSAKCADWLKLNTDETAVVAGMCDLVWTEQSELLESLSRVDPYWDEPFLPLVLVTHGGNGCQLLHQTWQEVPPDSRRRVREWITEPGVPARIVDTVGAGDAFTAAMVCLHLEGRPLRECARFATHYAARVCEHQGGTPRIDRAEVERAAFGSGL